jgi:hypothetical protein
MQPEESKERGERDARQSREGSGSDLGRVANENNLRQRTKEFALQIIRMFSGLPKTTEALVLGKQVLRSGTSVGANYREAYRARSRAEWSEWDERHARQRREGSGSESGGERMNLSPKCRDSLRELEETGYWLDLLAEANLLAPEKLRNVRQEWSDWDERHAR